jgi:ribosome-binding protein aMBF1 (putative translation factor)
MTADASGQDGRTCPTKKSERTVDVFERPVDDPTITAMLASIGRQARDARVERGWYLSDLAVRLELSPSVVCRLELARREASVHQLITVFAAFGLRLGDALRVAEDEAFPLGSAPWSGR